jgi:protein phosphatase
MRPLSIPELALVVLIGPSGSGKSTFARTHFKPTEIISSDYCRGLVSDDENNQEATRDAFDVLHYVAGKRLTRGLLTVVDATNVQPEARAPLVRLAKDHDVLPVAVVLNLDDRLCHERNRGRADRQFGPHVCRNQAIQLRRSLRGLEREGFRYVHVLETPEEVAAATFERQPLWNNRKHDAGPFDIVGDVHGCYEELVALLTQLGYTVNADHTATPPAGRKAVFLGDLVDRGPDVVGVLKLVMSMVGAGTALCVPGNHDVKLLKKLRGRDVQIKHGLAETLEQLAKEPAEFVEQVGKFIDKLVGHYVLDGGRLAVAHAGLKEQYIGRASNRVREFALYGETTGETDEFGLPVRYNWAAEYRGKAAVVYGHTPVPNPEWLNNTINLDTGCVFGGRLTAMRWPERTLHSVAAGRVYSEPVRPLVPAAPVLTAQQAQDDLLDIEDVTGKRIVQTQLAGAVTVREENALAALEVMSRFAANPKWLIYLPPTMSPPETTQEPGLLEHPAEAFGYYAAQGVAKVVCEEKHMGSRAVVVVCRDAEAATRRFGVVGEGRGIVYTRTGRRFFDDPATEAALLERLAAAVTKARWWERFRSDWFCLDCELMPWSVKAQDLLKNQYAAVGSAGRAALEAAVPILRTAAARHGSDSGLQELAEEHEARRRRMGQYVEAYGRYCWPVRSIEDLKLAPFHLLASEEAVHTDKDHLWHMRTLAELSCDPVFMATEHRLVELDDAASTGGAVEWWTRLTGAGGEGMVVKPLEFIARGPKGLVQPAVKCRGPEYLRIIYGPEYDAANNLPRLRHRSVGPKRGLASREFALGVEGLNRFVQKQPLRAVHECAFAVLALESEPVDPRL